MFIEDYYSSSDQGISFSRQQACRFAKKVADDFNPLHNATAKRFCVPGDLLFSVILAKAGIYQKMDFTFSGMVNDDIALIFPEKITQPTAIIDNNNKEYLTVDAQGDVCKNEALLSSLTKAYVAFSGHTFPHILVGLMAEKNIMINPARPMVMYQSMSIELDHFNATEIELKLSNSSLEHNGKRGQACLYFDLISDGNIVGRGKKYMTLSGLREYCQESIDKLVSEYQLTKDNYRAKQA